MKQTHCLFVQLIESPDGQKSFGQSVHNWQAIIVGEGGGGGGVDVVSGGGGAVDVVAVVGFGGGRLTEHKMPGPQAVGTESGGRLEAGDVLESAGSGDVSTEVEGSRSVDVGVLEAVDVSNGGGSDDVDEGEQ